MDAVSLSQGLGVRGWGLGNSSAVSIPFETYLPPSASSPSPAPSSPSPAPSSPSPAPSPQPLAPTVREAFNDFVGQTFFGELLKQMRATVDKPAYFHGGLGEEVFQSQMDQLLVERMSEVTGPTFSDPMYELLMARKG